MKVYEFATRLGIPASKIRYYDRNGVISGKRLEKTITENMTELMH